MAEQTALKSVALLGVEGAVHVSLVLVTVTPILTTTAIEVGKTENIGSTALGSAVKASAWNIRNLSLLVGGKGRDNSAQEGDGSE